MPTKVHLVKAMVLPVAMYGCESWTIKKTEFSHYRADLPNTVTGLLFEVWNIRGQDNIKSTIK